MSGNDSGIKLEHIISVFPASVYWKDIEGKYLGCNLCQAKLLNLPSPEAIKGKTDFDFYLADEANRLRSVDLKVARSKKSETIQEEGTLPNLGKRKFLSKKIPLLDKKDNVIGIVGVSMQLEKESKCIEEENISFVRELAKRVMGQVDEDQTLRDYVEDVRYYFDSIIALLPGHIYWQDKNNVFLGCNNLQAEHAGLSSREEIVGKTNHDMIWKDEADDLNRINKHVVQTGLPYVAEETATMANGTRAYLSNKTPLKSRSGKVVGVLGVSLDISELKETQEELIRTQKNEARLKTLSAVGGMIAHELRTPLAAVGNTAKSLDKFFPQLLEGYEQAVSQGIIKRPIRPDLLESIKESIAGINQSTEYAQSTIATILAGLHYSNTQQVEGDITAFSLKTVVDKALQQYPLSEEQRQLINTDAVNDITVFSEIQIMVHVFHNLLKNSLHAIGSTHQGTITVSTVDDKDHAKLIFADTAKGIPPEHLPHIFEPFYTTKKKTAQSVGLGLYFCRMALQRVGTQIECDSEWGQYTKFTMTMPKQHQPQQTTKKRGSHEQD